MSIPGNKVEFISDLGHVIPVAEVGTVRFEQSYGMEPNHTAIAFHDDYKAIYDQMVEDFEADSDKPYVRGKFRFTHSNHVPNEPAVVTDWEGWYVMRVQLDQTFDDLWVMSVADMREAMRNLKFTGKLNVYYDNGVGDPESLVFGAPHQLETAMNALIDALNTELGVSGYFEFGGLLHADVTDLQLEYPLNLGNTQMQYGGFIGADWKDVMEPIAKAYQLYPIVGTNGKLYLTSSTRERNDIADPQFGSMIGNEWMFGSHAGTTDMKAAKPKSLDIIFEVKSEVMLIGNPPSTGNLQNGMYLYEVMRKPSDLTDNFVTLEWVELDEWAQHFAGKPGVPDDFNRNAVGVNDYLRKRAFGNPIFPYAYDKSNNPPLGRPLAGSEVLDFLESEVLQHWRKAWYVDTDEQRFANMQMGRITADGGRKVEGAVWADYTFLRSRARVSPNYSGEFGPDTDVLAYVDWSESVSLFQVARQPAPFTAFWRSPTDKIVGIETDGVNPLIVREVILGLLDGPLGVVKGAIDLERDGNEGGDPGRFVFTRAEIGKPGGPQLGNYNLRIIAVANPTSQGKRSHKITKSLFADGTIPKQQLRVYGVTANKAYSDAQLANFSRFFDDEPEVILNAAEMDEVADRVKEEVRRSYDQGVMGAVKAGGLHHFGIQAGGACNEMWVEYGGDTSFSLTQNWSLQPGRIVITLGRIGIDGQPVKVAV